MDRKEILLTAEKMVNGSRQDDYGRPENTFGMIAELWSTYLKYRLPQTDVDPTAINSYPFGDLTSWDVAALMILLKIARIGGGHGKSDNWIDIAGYAACGGELDQFRGANRTIAHPGVEGEEATHERASICPGNPWERTVAQYDPR